LRYSVIFEDEDFVYAVVEDAPYSTENKKIPLSEFEEWSENYIEDSYIADVMI